MYQNALKLLIIVAVMQLALLPKIATNALATWVSGETDKTVPILMNAKSEFIIASRKQSVKIQLEAIHAIANLGTTHRAVNNLSQVKMCPKLSKHSPSGELLCYILS